MAYSIEMGHEVEPRIITYYGIGGIGKSTLLKQIQKEMDEDWAGNMNQHLLGELSEVDTSYFLHEAGIRDVVLNQEIYRVTKGVPVYLDLVVDNYYHTIQRGETPTIDGIGTSY